LRMKEGLEVIEEGILGLLGVFGEKITEYADLPCMAYTHLNPAEPTTLGYRFAFYAQDLLMDYQMLQFVKTNLRAKGLKGAVGTAASYSVLTGGGKKAQQMEDEAMAGLGLEAA